MKPKSDKIESVLRVALDRSRGYENLARILGTSRQRVHGWYNGRCNPNAEMYSKLEQYIKDTFVPFKPGEE
jgi:hypothetical protein